MADSRSVADLSQANNFNANRNISASQASSTSPLRVLFNSQSPGSNSALYGSSELGQMFSSSFEDWSRYNVFYFEVTNRASHVVALKPTVFHSNTTSPVHFGKVFLLNPGETQKIAFYFNSRDFITKDPATGLKVMNYGLKYVPPLFSHNNFLKASAEGITETQLKSVYKWYFQYRGIPTGQVDSAGLPLYDTTQTNVPIEFSKIELVRQAFHLRHLVDRYGQYNHGCWAEKVTSDQELVNDYITEGEDLTANPGPAEYSNGTSSVAAKAVVTGKWSIGESISGKKYFMNPSGKLFWSFGINSLAALSSTKTTGFTNPNGVARSDYFAFGTQNSVCAGSKDGALTYSFYCQNALIKYSRYGTVHDFKNDSVWRRRLFQRLRSLGINTNGMDSSDYFYLSGKLPFMVRIMSFTDARVRLKVPNMMWGPLPDPYVTDYVSYLKSRFTTELSAYTGQTMFAGVFIDNELSFGDSRSLTSYYNIPLGALAAPSTQPARKAFITILKAKYPTIGDLNLAWGTQYTSFDGMTAPSTSLIKGAMQTDFKNFIKAFGVKYFSGIKEALDPARKFLYLGPRFAQHNPEILQAAAPYVDVYSFNNYNTEEKQPWAIYSSLSKPAMISEVGFSPKSGGDFGGAGEVANSVAQGQEVQKIVDRALREPNVVGVHLYNYISQERTGRWSDYENASFGIYDVTDRPKPDVVKAIRSVGGALYKKRN